MRAIKPRYALRIQIGKAKRRQPECNTFELSPFTNSYLHQIKTIRNYNNYRKYSGGYKLNCKRALAI